MQATAQVRNAPWYDSGLLAFDSKYNVTQVSTKLAKTSTISNGSIRSKSAGCAAANAGFAGIGESSRRATRKVKIILAKAKMNKPNVGNPVATVN